MVLQGPQTVECLEVSRRGPGRLGGPRLEPLAVRILVPHRQQRVHRDGPFAQPGTGDVRQHVDALDDDLRALRDRPLYERVDAGRQVVSLLEEPRYRAGGTGRRIVQGPRGVEGRIVDGRHELAGEESPDDLAD